MERTPALQRRATASGAGPAHAPAASVHAGISPVHGAPLHAWAGSPRQQAQQTHIAQLRRAAAPTDRSDGLPAPLRQGIESLSGQDMSEVRVHRNSGKPAQLSALAYAQGNDIHLAPGQEKQLAHEAWHVVQQRQQRVRPTVEVGGQAVNDSPALEREADRMGALASRQAPAPAPRHKR